MILIAYDGSPDAQAAIDRAATLESGEKAIVLAVWEPFVEVMARTGAGFAPEMVDFQAIDKSTQEAAHTRAEEGAERARAAGLDAEGRTRMLKTTITNAILAEAEAIGASAVVIGSRGLTGVKSVVLGSVSTALVHHADRPVIVVPSPDVARERRERLAAIDE